MQEKQQIVAIDASKSKRAENFAYLYINNTQFGYTKFDFQMICGRIGFTLDADQNVLEEVGLITMSPEHAKAVLGALQTSIEGYERDHGEILVPKDKEAVLAGESETQEG